jgi:hypothetical protein
MWLSRQGWPENCAVWVEENKEMEGIRDGERVEDFVWR